MNRSFSLSCCLALTLAVTSHALADVPFDGDGDADVGFTDFVLFAGCQQGPDASALSACIEPFDFEFDNDIDLRDFAAFQQCFSGENLPRLTDCAEHQVRIENGCLHIVGTVGDSNLTLRLNAASSDNLDIEVNGVIEFTIDRGLFGCILIDARSGDDQIRIDETNGIFTTTKPTTVNGGRGNDSFFGGTGGETFVGGDGTDTATMGVGNDRFIWNPGDDSDVIEGNDGLDTIEVNGSNGAEQFTLTANGTRVRFDRLSASPFFLDIGTSESLVLNAHGGNDSLACTGNLAPLIQITADGGPGNDTLLGSNGADVLVGGDDNDFIDGQQGADVAFLGAGDDTFQWDPGDGNDVVEGQAGHDIMLFNGSAGSEIFDFSANGSRLRFTRNLGNIVMDTDEVEQVDLRALGSTDTASVNDLTGTDVVQINIDLTGLIGGATGDGQIDQVVVNGTNADDVILINGDANGVSVLGLAARVTITMAETALDRLTLNTLAGNDIIDASGLIAGSIQLTANGDAGDDILVGGGGNDTLSGGDNDDTLLGGPGADVLDGGVGENTVIQDGSAATAGIVTIFGDAGVNTIAISRDVGGNILSNGIPIPGATIANTALIRVFGLGGDDVITINEANGALPPASLFGGAGLDILTGGSGADLLLGGTGNDSLLAKGGFDHAFGGAGNDTLTGGDADDLVFGEAGNDRFIWNPGDDTDLNEGGSSSDTVEVNGGNGDEQFTVTANGARVRFDRLNPAPFSLDIGTCEDLVLNANGGNDSLACTGNLAALIRITADGGAGDDTLLGSNGADLLRGGDNNDFIDGQQGADVAFLGDGNDTFQWDPGDGNDIIEGQAGHDIMLFNGSAGSEIFTFSANGGRLLFTRNLGNIVMDTDDVEQVDLRALSSTDAVTVNSLAGTDVTLVNIDLAGTIGGATGDATADAIVVNGTSAADTINVAVNAGAVEVSGLTALVRILRSEAATDSLTVNGLNGADSITQGPGLAALIQMISNP